MRMRLTSASALSSRVSTSVRCLQIKVNEWLDICKCYLLISCLMDDATYFLVKGVRECLSYRQCLRYLIHTSHVGSARSQRAFLLRHSLHTSSDDPMNGISERGSLSTAADDDSSPCPGLRAGRLTSMMHQGKGCRLLRS